MAPSVCETVDNDNLASDQDTISNDSDDEQTEPNEKTVRVEKVEHAVIPDDQQTIGGKKVDQTEQAVIPDDQQTVGDKIEKIEEIKVADEKIDQTELVPDDQQTNVSMDEEQTEAKRDEEDLTSVSSVSSVSSNENLNSFKIYDLDEIEADADLTSNYTIQSLSTVPTRKPKIEPKEEKISVLLPRSINGNYDNNLVIELLDDDVELSRRVSLLKSKVKVKVL